MKTKTRLHDGIVGALILGCLALGHYVSHAWLYVAAAIAALMITSVVTGFCPVYFVLNRLMPDRE